MRQMYRLCSYQVIRFGNFFFSLTISFRLLVSYYVSYFIISQKMLPTEFAIYYQTAV